MGTALKLAAQRSGHEPRRYVDWESRRVDSWFQNRPDLVDAQRRRLHARVGPR